MPTIQKTWTRLDLDLPPEEVAARLASLGGLVFLDTSTVNFGTPSRCHSVVGARPLRTIRGHLSNLAPIREALAELRHSGNWHGEDLGFPTGGAFGTVDYDGSYTFALHDRLLVYQYQDNSWLQTGDAIEGAIHLLRADPPTSPVPGAFSMLEFQPGLDRDAYCALVGRAIEYIAAGDIYQVNIAHRFRSPWPKGAHPMDFYRRLRDASPAPYASYLDQGSRQVLSASPECFLRLSGQEIETRPIKGTRPRFRDPAADEKSAYDLITSPKEIAELVMITDLERNDLGQVCEYGSVTVPELLKLERFAQVFHLVSTVAGRLRSDVDQPEALARCFPGGSITGAPKRRAREIIDELEPVERGLFTGAIGYLGTNGESQFSIAIRTAVVEEGHIHFHAGSGIVADSIPEREYEETFHKAAGFLSATRL